MVYIVYHDLSGFAAIVLLDMYENIELDFVRINKLLKNKLFLLLLTYKENINKVRKNYSTLNN